MHSSSAYYTSLGEQGVCLPFVKSHILAPGSGHDHPILQVAAWYFHFSNVFGVLNISNFLFQNLQGGETAPSGHQVWS